MANDWMDEVEKVLGPLMMCSVEQRYQLLAGTKFGKRCLSTLDLQGSLLNVKNSVCGILMRFGGVDDFLKEFCAMPVPEWYKEMKRGE